MEQKKEITMSAVWHKAAECLEKIYGVRVSPMYISNVYYNSSTSVSKKTEKQIKSAIKICLKLLKDEGHILPPCFIEYRTPMMPQINP
jgi:hypothetical protein